MKKQKNTSQTKGVAIALVPFTQKINETNNIDFHQLISSKSIESAHLFVVLNFKASIVLPV